MVRHFRLLIIVLLAVYLKRTNTRALSLDWGGGEERKKLGEISHSDGSLRYVEQIIASVRNKTFDSVSGQYGLGWRNWRLDTLNRSAGRRSCNWKCTVFDVETWKRAHTARIYTPAIIFTTFSLDEEFHGWFGPLACILGPQGRLVSRCLVHEKLPIATPNDRWQSDLRGLFAALKYSKWLHLQIILLDERVNRQIGAVAEPSRVG